MKYEADTTVGDLRRRLLRTAYLNRSWPVRTMALAADRILVWGASLDPAGAELLVKDLANGSVPYQELVLERARGLGVDPEEWKQRAQALAGYDLFPHDIPAPGAISAAATARRWWATLLNYWPQEAAALAEYLQAMPDGWLLDLFNAPSADAVQHEGTRNEQPPDIAPAAGGDDECPACDDVNDLCRFHRGWLAGEANLRAVLATALTDAQAITALRERQQDLARRSPAAPETDAPNPEDQTAVLLRLLAIDDLALDAVEERHRDLQNQSAQEERNLRSDSAS
jgi:hypothetical protein